MPGSEPKTVWPRQPITSTLSHWDRPDHRQPHDTLPAALTCAPQQIVAETPDNNERDHASSRHTGPEPNCHINRNCLVIETFGVKIETFAVKAVDVFCRVSLEKD